MKNAMSDDLFDALADSQRRRILVELLDHNPQDASVVPETKTTTERERDLLMSHHVHLPKLDDYGFIEWDRSDGVVTRGPRFDEIRPVLESIDDLEDESSGEQV